MLRWPVSCFNRLGDGRMKNEEDSIGGGGGDRRFPFSSRPANRLSVCFYAYCYRTSVHYHNIVDSRRRGKKGRHAGRPITSRASPILNISQSQTVFFLSLFLYCPSIHPSTLRYAMWRHRNKRGPVCAQIRFAVGHIGPSDDGFSTSIIFSVRRSPHARFALHNQPVGAQNTSWK